MKKSALHIRSVIPDILKAWEKLVKKEVPASQKTNTLVLYDHLPDILIDISDILERISHEKDLKNDQKFTEIIENSVYHGRHRASTLQYTVDQVVHEYLLFYRILCQNLRKANLYSKEVAEVLECIINTAILKSTESFSQAIQEMQEKLIGTLAHDIRNPLSAAQLSLEMIDVDLNEERFNKMKSAASRSVKKALELIEGLMDAISIRAGEGISLNFEKIDIAQVIQLVYLEATEIYTQSIKFSKPEKEIQGVFDETAVRRLLENLITNAIKYGDSKSGICINLEDLGEEVALSVHNQGNPIPAEEKERIFNFLAKNNKSMLHRSWGMGLALVKMVAEAHGGEVLLESSEDQGTTFTAKFKKNSNKPGKQNAKLRTPKKTEKLADPSY